MANLRKTNPMRSWWGPRLRIILGNPVGTVPPTPPTPNPDLDVDWSSTQIKMDSSEIDFSSGG